MPRPLLLLLVAALSACTGGTPTPAAEDADRDGVAALLDCDDGDARINPGADEVCDGVDNDCDGKVDADDPEVVGAITLYADVDGDGFGDRWTSAAQCGAPEGWVDNTDDCDDDDDRARPGGVEVCDFADNDCDGLVDAEDPDTPGVFTAWEDADLDGFGSAVERRFCTLPATWSLVQGDCADDDPRSFPGADERCDERDNDCDEAVDEDAVDAIAGYFDGDGDGYGDPLVQTAACAEVPGFVLNAGDCDDDDLTRSPAAVERCDGIDNDCDMVVDGPDADGVLRRFRDADADGWGNPREPLFTCDEVEGWVMRAQDCDDADLDRNPDAEERCDGIDNDCDDLIDGPTATGVLARWADLDGDGYGDPLAPLWICAEQAGAVDDATDCDDGRDRVHPGAVERCGDGEVDCDPATTTDGRATFRPLVGEAVEVTDLLQGAPDAPARWSPPEAGQVQLCRGVWYAQLDLGVDIWVRGVDGMFDTELVAPIGRAITGRGDGLDLRVTGLTVRDGAGDPTDLLDNGTWGGAVACQGASTLSISSARVIGSAADRGGAVASDGCALTLSAVKLEDNVAATGGAVWVRGADLVVEDSLLTLNTAADLGGAIAIIGGVVALDLSRVTGNVGGDAGGVWLGDDAALTCVGFVGDKSGIYDNDGATAGGVRADGAAFTVTSDACDWGDALTGDDNAPADLVCATCGPQAWSWTTDATFTCTAAGCAP